MGGYSSLLRATFKTVRKNSWGSKKGWSSLLRATFKILNKHQGVLKGVVFITEGYIQNTEHGGGGWGCLERGGLHY